MALSSFSSGSSSVIDTSALPPCHACTLELCAGIVDKDVSLEEIARQELLEEVGYDVPVSKLEKIVSCRCVGVLAKLISLLERNSCICRYYYYFHENCKIKKQSVNMVAVLLLF